MTGEVSTVVFSVDRMEDPAGNIVDQVQTFTTDEVNTATVKIDATPPKLKTGTVSFTTADTSNEDDPDLTSTNTLLAKNGEAIYFDFETEERIENPSVTINGSALSSLSDVSPLDSTGTKWRATYTPSVTGEVTTVVFSVDRMEDPAGNIVDQVETFTTDEVNTSTVKIDATPPKLKPEQFLLQPRIQAMMMILT